MEKSELDKALVRVKKSVDIIEITKFMNGLCSVHDDGRLDYHYCLLAQKNCSDEFYAFLCRAFHRHGEAGELFLLSKISREKDTHLKGIILQMLGGYKYYGGKHCGKTAEMARSLIISKDVFLRNRAAIVTGWVGDVSDIDILAKRIVNEKDTETRGWTATALMQLFFNNDAVKEHKDRLLDILKNALEAENDDFVMNCILVSIQEICGKKLGISSVGHEVPPRDKLEKAKAKALRLPAREK